MSIKQFKFSYKARTLPEFAVFIQYSPQKFTAKEWQSENLSCYSDRTRRAFCHSVKKNKVYTVSCSNNLYSSYAVKYVNLLLRSMLDHRKFEEESIYTEKGTKFFYPFLCTNLLSFKIQHHVCKMSTEL